MNEFIILFRETLEAALIVGIIYLFLTNNNALYDDGNTLTSRTSRTSSVETFFKAPEANGLVQIFPDFDDPDPDDGTSRSLRRDLLGRITPIENIQNTHSNPQTKSRFSKLSDFKIKWHFLWNFKNIRYVVAVRQC